MIKAFEEIDRLKSQINNKNSCNLENTIDKLTNQLNKDNSNSSILTSKEIRKKLTLVHIIIVKKSSTKLMDNMVMKVTL